MEKLNELKLLENNVAKRKMLSSLVVSKLQSIYLVQV